ncbi:MAG TPA: glycosyltransferase [Gammaproteobacteria bacterium]|nr:glycosyltransferase [Gammaproteobacteria bacterium]
MTRVGILTPRVTSGDAVSNDVFGMYQRLNSEGIEAAIFADSSQGVDIPVRKRDQVNEFLGDPKDVFIYHHSVGWPSGIELLESIGCRKAVKYHNVTPAEYFLPYNEDYANACSVGRQELASIAQVPDAVLLSDSQFNMNELVAVGADLGRCFVVPPFHHADRLYELHADLSVLDSLSDGAVNILAVGRLAPNKAHHRLLESFATYNRYYNSNSRLLIVGVQDPRLSGYISSLRVLARQFGVAKKVVFAGAVSDESLKAHYLASTLFVTASDHEGFCVPLVESMALKLPILAYGSTAIPETVDGCGVVWEDYERHLFAESMDYLHRHESLRFDLSMNAQKRFQQVFSNSRIGDMLMDSLSALL